MGRIDITLNIEDILINALYGFSLLRNHIGKLSEDLAELSNGCFNGLDGIRPLLDIGILEMILVSEYETGSQRRRTCCSTNCICMNAPPALPLAWSPSSAVWRSRESSSFFGVARPFPLSKRLVVPSPIGSLLEELYSTEPRRTLESTFSKGWTSTY
jgi:hypothetical protein